MMLLVGKTGDLLPQAARLVVGVIDRDQEPVLGQADSLVTKSQASVIASSLK